MESEEEKVDSSSVQSHSPRDLDRILDIPLTIRVELGRKRMRISELLDVGSGAVVELDAPSGTPLS
ncbi:MAG: FliM/FliN family flagellar motor switch protein, partial [Myxococcota bacterium]